MKHIGFLISVILLFTALSISGQEQTIAESTQSLTKQFQVLEKKSASYRANDIRYKVIRVTFLDKIKQNIFDSINTANKSIKDLTATIVANNVQIDSLDAELKKTSDDLKQVGNKKDNIPFFGTLVSKGTYKAIFWCTVVILLLLLSLFVYKFRNSNHLTQQAKKSLADLEEEYEEHRKRALEREQKISRRLQDELNKNKK